ncbi:PREDICTED: probable L-cysteine desulfhydrase, chloroplastic [Prunus mume]|uniref:Probable L-cysteine desulfhydrase, chloroplastic n=1 Tax=Prunus mume TaxID=102107 RepID=A0ABM0PY13_PRUMU|nr:PREDICTED: probable L-cysteine desulfhydrase, chloroplastic [Prunus mume]
MAERIIMFCRYYVLLVVLLPYRTLQFFYHKLSFQVSRASNLDAAEGVENHAPIEPKPSSSFITNSEIQSEFAHHAPGVAMMNNGSFGCCPASVISALHQWQLKMLRQPCNFFLNDLQNRILESRTIIKDLINAEDVDEVSIVDNISTAAAIVLQQTAWAFAEGKFNKGDAVIMFSCTYGAVKNSIKAYFSRAGGYVIEVPFNFPLNSNEEIISEFRKALEREKGNGRKVRLAVIDHVTCMPSIVMPVKQLVKIVREEGVEQVFIDAAHGVGCVDVDMQEIGADFYASTLYKWFFCPPAAAFLYCRKSATYSDLELHHPVVSHRYGKGLAEESFWVGTRDYSPYLVLPSAMEFVKRFEGGVEGIRKMNHDAVLEMGKMLAEAWGTNLGCPPDMCASMIMIGLPSCLGISSDDDAMKLWAHLRKKFGVEVRIHYQAPKDGEVVLTTGYVRICHQIYNKVDDYYKLRDTINQLVHDGLALLRSMRPEEIRLINKKELYI